MLSGGAKLVDHDVDERHGKSCAQTRLPTLRLNGAAQSIFPLERVKKGCRSMHAALVKHIDSLAGCTEGYPKRRSLNASPT